MMTRKLVKYDRASITIPSGLKEDLKRAGIKNWSRICSEALEQFLQSMGKAASDYQEPRVLMQKECVP